MKMHGPGNIKTANNVENKYLACTKLSTTLLKFGKLGCVQ
jgi:hypothetical protein